MCQERAALWMRLLGPLPDFQGARTRGDDSVTDYGDMLARKVSVDFGSLGDIESKLSATGWRPFPMWMLP